MRALEAAGVDALFIDHSVSGTATSRPRFDAMLADLRPGDTVVVYSLSRLSRGMNHLVELGEKFEAEGIGLVSLTESIDTSTAMGRFVYTMLAALAAMERDLLAERTCAGLAAARGKVEGRRKYSPRSVNYMLGLLMQVLESEKRQGKLVRNVAELVDRVPADPKQFRTFTEKEILRVIDYQSRDRARWVLALYGLRRGEVAGLRWENVDLKAGTVAIVENRVAVGKEAIVGTPKSTASRRTLPLPDDALAALKVARKAQTAEKLLLGEDYVDSGYVACNEGVEPLTPATLSFRWGRMLDGLGSERVRLHDARHSCATLMHLRGVPIAVIAAWLGHSSAAFTMATYAHSQDEALKAAAQSFRPVEAI